MVRRSRTGPSGSGAVPEDRPIAEELKEAREQQAATAEILHVISRSPSDVQPVFDSIAKNAVRLCNADHCFVYRLDDGLLHLAAHHGVAPPAAEDMRRNFPAVSGRGHAGGRAVLSGSVEQIPDVTKDAEFTLGMSAEISRARSVIAVPMMHAGTSIGAIGLGRVEVGLFPERQVELLKTFADQAVIAIENVRLFQDVQTRTQELEARSAELRESLQQQTATAEVLRVISSSPGDLEPVFQSMLENAVRICAAKFGVLVLWEGGGEYRVAALYGVPPQLAEELRIGTAIHPAPRTILEQVASTKQLTQVADAQVEQGYLEPPPGFLRSRVVTYGGARTMVGVPMLRENELVGTIVIYRTEVRAFTDKQIELVSTFAAQAVIAIENTRLLNELRRRTDDLSEALEQQTATSEVLQVISSSPGKLEPVFGAMLSSAIRICEAKFGNLFLREGEGFRAAAVRGERAFVEHWQREPYIDPRGSPGGPLDMLTKTNDVVHVTDVAAEQAYRASPRLLALVERAGARTLLAVPMLKEGELVGAIAIYRQEVRPFSEKLIELVKNFAAQAVIAIENTRLLNELRVSLQQQTATAEVLKTISNSTFDLDAVLTTLVQSAVDLCHASAGHVVLRDGDLFRPTMQVGFTHEFDEYMKAHPMRAGRGTMTGRVALTKSIVHIPDVLDDPEYTLTEGQKLGGFRTTLGVPLIRDGEVLGVFSLARSQAEPFKQREIELVQSFADQAVIAIENVRLFEEVQKRGEALAASVEEQKSLAAVSQVVNSSLDLETVLATILSHACVFADSGGGSIYIYDAASDELVLDATYGMDDELRAALGGFRVRMGETVLGQCAEQRRPLQISDVEETDARDMPTRDVLLGAGIRAILAVPLLRGEEVIGALVVRRRRPGEFPEAMVELLQTFAAQSALAIHNARLFDKLSRSLEDLRTAQDRLVQTEKLASLGQLTAGIAHEIKNPLNFVNNFSSLAMELIDELNEVLEGADLASEKRTEIGDLAGMLKINLKKVVQHGGRADAIVKNMLLHSRQGSSEHRLADINAIVEESVNLAYHGARAEKQGFNITMEKSLDPNAGKADLYPQEITRVLLNLISNGLYAATKRKERADGSDYEPTLTASTKNLGDRVEIRIRDNGTGIPPEVKEKLFSPFFTTKPAGEGTGLGLSISHDIIVKQHAGMIEVESEPGAFTEFRIVLPRRAASLGKPGG